MKPILVTLRRSGFGLLNFILLLGFCAEAARWTWEFAAPASVAALTQPEPPHQFSEQIIAAHLFSSSVAAESAPPSNIHLQGVFAGAGDHQGYAILLVNGNSMSVPAQGKIEPDTRLKAIFGDHVLLDRDGATQRLNLEPIAAPADLKLNP